MAFVTQSILGTDFYTAITYNPASSPDIPAPPFAVGSTVIATDGGIFTFVKLAASQTIAAGDFVYVSSTDDTWIVTSLANAAKALLGAPVGVACAAATSGTTSYLYIWIQRAGYYATANVLTASAANTALHTTATAGRVDDTAVGGTSATVAGVIQTAVAASNQAKVQLNWPTIGAAD